MPGTFDATQRKTAVIVEDDALAAVMVKRILEGVRPEFSSIRRFASGREAIRFIVDGPHADVGLMVTDIRLEDLNGHVVCRYARHESVTFPILAITSLAVRKVENQVMRAGAQGLLSKDSSLDQWAEALRQVLEEGHMPGFESPMMANARIGCSERRGTLLTATEELVISWCAHGWDDESIAEQLRISQATVRKHRQNICVKWDCATLREAIAHWNMVENSLTMD